MTFTIQFMFRKAQSFNVGAGLRSNLCLNWDSFVEKIFDGESIFPPPHAHRTLSHKTCLEDTCLYSDMFHTSNYNLEKEC